MTSRLPLSYRFASSKDFNDIYELYMDEVSNPFLSYDWMEKCDFEIVYQELLASGNLFVVEWEGEIAGSYRLIRKTNRQSGTWYLGGFVVKSSLKGKGIGAQMLEQMKSQAALSGITRIELTVSLDNEAAIRLYKKAGFETEGLIRKSYRFNSSGEYYDEYLMGWVLE